MHLCIYSYTCLLFDLVESVKVLKFCFFVRSAAVVTIDNLHDSAMEICKICHIVDMISSCYLQVQEIMASRIRGRHSSLSLFR